MEIMGAVVRKEISQQVVTPRRRQTTKKIKTQGLISTIYSRAVKRLRFLSYMIATSIIVWCGYLLVTSNIFQLSEIEIVGHSRLSTQEIEKLIRQNIPNNLLLASLNNIQHSLETLTWVKHAQVVRILPNKVQVKLEERKPLLLAKFNGQENLVWVDEDGVILGGYEPTKDRNLPPIVIGFTSDRSENTLNENKERIEVYKKLIWTFDSESPKYTEQIEYVDLSHVEDVVVHLNKNNIVVHLGNNDYRSRFAHVVELLNVIQHRDQAALGRLKLTDPRILQYADKISYINVIDPVRMAIGFRQTNTQKNN